MEESLPSQKEGMKLRRYCWAQEMEMERLIQVNRLLSWSGTRINTGVRSYVLQTHTSIHSGSTSGSPITGARMTMWADQRNMIFRYSLQIVPKIIPFHFLQNTGFRLIRFILLNRESLQ